MNKIILIFSCLLITISCTSTQKQAVGQGSNENFKSASESTLNPENPKFKTNNLEIRLNDSSEVKSISIKKMPK